MCTFILKRKCIFKIMTALNLFITCHTTLTSLLYPFIPPCFPLLFPAIIPKLHIHSLPFLNWFSFQASFLSLLFLQPFFFITSFIPWPSIRSGPTLFLSSHLFSLPSFACLLSPFCLTLASLKSPLLTSPLCILVCYFSLFNLLFFPITPTVCFLWRTYS